MFEGFFGQYGEVDMAPMAGCEPMAKKFQSALFVIHMTLHDA